MVTFRNYDEKERIDRVWYQSSNIVFTECLDNPDSLKTLTVTFKNNRRYRYDDVDVNDYVKNQNDFTNSPNHFTRNIYYAMAQDITKLINENSGMKIKTVDNFYLQKVKTIITKVTRKLKRVIRSWFT